MRARSFRSRAAVLLTVFSLASAGPAAAQHLRISVDTAPNHIRNITLRTFLARLSDATHGAVTGELFESGQLFAARDEPKAVATGELDMSVTTNSAISAFVSDLSLLDMPLFSGLDPKIVDAVVDGGVGKALNQRIEQRLKVTVPGRWFLLGTADTFGGDKAVRSFEDFKGLRVRVPGGAAFVARYKALGASAVSIPFPDVPLALSQGTIDALLTTDETLRSAKLYESGVRSGFADHISVLYYIPLVSRNFWGKLTPEQRTIFTTTWESVIDDERVEAMRRQDQARADNAKAGVTYVTPTPDAVRATNDRLRALVPQLAKDLRVDPSLVDLATSEIDKNR